MTTRTPRKVVRASGRLVTDPTDSDFTGTFPFGGTELGWSVSVTLRRVTEEFSILAEEFGSVPVEVLEAGEFWLAGAYLRTWDPDAIEALGNNTRTGTRTALPVLQLSHNLSGGRRAGQRVSDRAIKLLFYPDDVYRAQGWVMYTAAPLFDVASPFQFDAEEELGPRVLFVGLPSGSDLDVGEVGPLVDLGASA